MTPENRAAIVVGGAGGIGAAIGHRLAADGYGVVIADQDADRARTVAASLSGEAHSCAQLDVTDEQDVHQVFDRIEATRPAAVLVIASGGPQADLSTRPTIATMSTSDWHSTVELNLTGVFYAVRKFAQLRLAHPLENSRIITIGSGSAQVPQAVIDVSYVAAKGGVFSLSRQAAFDLAPAGITVNVVAPGLVGTPAFLRNTTEPVRAEAAAATLFNRLATPEEVAAGVAYLASPDAAYVTGATLDINGGLHMS